MQQINENILSVLSDKLLISINQNYFILNQFYKNKLNNNYSDKLIMDVILNTIETTFRYLFDSTYRSFDFFYF